jgi:hypothetical protein
VPRAACRRSGYFGQVFGCVFSVSFGAGMAASMNDRGRFE